MQYPIDLRNICHIGRRVHQAIHQARLDIHTDMGFHAEVPLIALLGLVHLWGALAVLVLGRNSAHESVWHRRWCPGATTGRDHPGSPLITPRTLPALVLFQHTTEVEDGGFVGNALQAQPSKLAQNSRLIQCLFHRWIAVVELVLHQMDT